MLEPIERVLALIALIIGGYASSVDATLKILEYRNNKKERSAQRSSDNDDEAKG